MSHRSMIPLLGLFLLVGTVHAFQSSTHVSRSTQTSLFAMPRRRQMPVKEVKPPMNEQITQSPLRVTAPSAKGKDEILGIMTRDEAMAKAKEMGNLDLVLMNNNSDPPVCKIVDYSKYRYMQEKKAKEVKKNSKASDLKEIKMSYKIDIHDYDVRKKSAFKFLRQGNRVKCTVMFRGREVQHDNLGVDLLEKLAAELEDTCVKEGKPKREGRFLSLFLTPRPEVMKLLNDERRAADKAKKQKRDLYLKNLAEGVVPEEEEDDDDDDDEEEEQPKAVAPKRKEKTLEELLGTSDYL